MPNRKLYAGAKLREVRTRIGLTQKDFAAKLGVSLPYLNQMENNNRPVSTAVVLGLAREFGLDVTELGSGDTERLVSDMREAIADPVFADTAPPLSDLRLAASNAPALARAFLDLHRAYRQTHERLASLDEALGQDRGQDGGTLHSPWEEVRDFFHYCDNYIDAVDRAAERFAGQAKGDLVAHTESVLRRSGVTLRKAAGAGVRHYDRATRTLTLSPRAAPETQRFQLLHQFALLAQDQLLEATLDLARFQTDTAREIAKHRHGQLLRRRGSDALHPLRRGRPRHPPRSRTDLDPVRRLDRAGRPPPLDPAAPRRQGRALLLRARRPGRHGHQAPLRHAAAIRPLRRRLPLVERPPCLRDAGPLPAPAGRNPDGARYVILARDVSKSGGAWGTPTRRYAISLGCEVTHAPQLVYADGLDLDRDASFQPIGISCRICERAQCHQRAVPPLERRLTVNPDHRGTLPYDIAD
jgi:transcriptional regulator with XRE-family HTH domain